MSHLHCSHTCMQTFRWQAFHIASSIYYSQQVISIILPLPNFQGPVFYDVVCVPCHRDQSRKSHSDEDLHRLSQRKINRSQGDGPLGPDPKSLALHSLNLT